MAKRREITLARCSHLLGSRAKNALATAKPAGVADKVFCVSKSFYERKGGGIMGYDALKKYLLELSKLLRGEPKGNFQHPCIVVTKDSSYPCQLWDWGNWLNNIALRQIARNVGEEEGLVRYEKGSVLNFLNEQREDGSIDIDVDLKNQLLNKILV